MTENRKSPLVSCSPFFVLFVLLCVAGWVGWKIAAPMLRGNVHDPDATPRIVAARGTLAEDEKSTIELFKSASPCCVNIMTSRIARDRFQLRPLDVPEGTGSGIVWDARGYIVTNLHVILNADRATVTLDNHKEYEARLVGFAADYDVAVLKIDAPGEELHAVPIGASNDLQVGQKAFAIGNPFGLDHTLSTGVISGLHREISSPSGRTISDVIQTDAAINPGNSGGLLLDSAGRLIGMNTAIASPTHSSAGIGFAVPVDTINLVVPGLIRKGNTDRDQRPVLGINAAAEPIAKAMGVVGIVVDTVKPGYGAEAAGLRSLEYDDRNRPIADVITSVAGQRVTKLDEIWEIMGEHKAGDVVPVDVLRDGKTLHVEIKLQDSN